MNNLFFKFLDIKQVSQKDYLILNKQKKLEVDKKLNTLQFFFQKPFSMIRTKSATSLIEQKPRKMLKLDLINQKQYNEFQGNSELDQKEFNAQSQLIYHDQNHDRKSRVKEQKHLNIHKEINQNQSIFNLIAQEHLKFRKVNDSTQSKVQYKIQSTFSKNVKKENTETPAVKFEEGTEPPIVKKEEKNTAKKQIKNAIKQKHKNSQPSSNWKKFLQNSKSSDISIKRGNGHNNLAENFGKDNKILSVNEPSKFLAMDCEFVKCGQTDELARISVVSQNGQTLYDSYIKPELKVTDFLTEITGITYTHIKQAPKWSQQIRKVKKILMGKIVVGHTLDKDLEVTKLINWKGISQKINIANFSEYKEKAGSKIVSLKRMALSFLNRKIQSGWHSSVEDAVATIDLFKLNKKKILKEFKLI